MESGWPCSRRRHSTPCRLYKRAHKLVCAEENQDHCNEGDRESKDRALRGQEDEEPTRAISIRAPSRPRTLSCCSQRAAVAETLAQVALRRLGATIALTAIARYIVKPAHTWLDQGRSTKVQSLPSGGVAMLPPVMGPPVLVAVATVVLGRPRRRHRPRLDRRVRRPGAPGRRWLVALAGAVVRWPARCSCVRSASRRGSAVRRGGAGGGGGRPGAGDRHRRPGRDGERTDGHGG